MDLNILSMSDALNDWLNFLQGPSAPVFSEGTTFEDGWKRMLRLILLVLMMLVAVLAFSYLGKNVGGSDGSTLSSFAKNTALQTQYTIIVILTGALFAALYSFTMARLFKITISLRQAFFTVLFMILPWIPIVVLVWSLVYVIPERVPFLAIFIVLFIFLIFPTIAIIQFSRGVALVSGCPKNKCVASVAIPSVVLFVLMFMVWKNTPISDGSDASAEPVSEASTRFTSGKQPTGGTS